MPELRKQPKRDRPERLALNLFDVQRMDANIRQKLLTPYLELDRDKIVRVDPDRLDETGVLLTGDLLTAACIADTVRQHDRAAGDPPTRVYLRRRETWERLPRDAVLTLVTAGGPVLSPAIFPAVEVGVRKYQARRVQRGGGT